MSRFLILTADDFGLHVAVNEGIEAAVNAGVLTAASLMVGEKAAEDAVERARRLPGLRVGLHLALADGRAVLPRSRIPNLVDSQGRFGDRMVRDGVRFFALPYVRRQLEDEIRAQFEAFAATGLTLDHVNAHKHFHLHPTVLSMMLRIGRDFGLAAGGVRVPAEPAWAARGGNRALAPWLWLMKGRLLAGGIRFTDQLFGLSHSGAMDAARLLAVLDRLPEGSTEIYLHPATRSGATIARTMAAYRHADELAALLSPGVHDRLKALKLEGVSCGGFIDLPDPAGSNTRSR